MTEVENSSFEVPAELVLLAMGFVRPAHVGAITDLQLKLDTHGNIIADANSWQSSVPNVFVAGDMRRGQSLVVWAIKEGRRVARAVDAYLMGTSELPD
jgi:glutamate synthase (NADPH/NADH) small chain